MELKQELKLKQTLSQKMIQSASILQMGQIELREYIEEMALENPVVDLEESETESGALEETASQMEKIRRLEELSSLDRQNQMYYQDEEEEAGHFEPGKSQDGLIESLLEQACVLHLPEKDEKIFRYMIKNLDANGYLGENFEDLCAELGIGRMEGEHIWENFRKLEPAGIGARSLKECLLMQLSLSREERQALENTANLDKQRPKSAGKQTELLAAQIISQYLDLLGKNQMKQIARACACRLEEVLPAAARIRELNPKPGSGYGDENYEKYIVPDIIVAETEHGFELQLSDETLPQIGINPYYLSLMKQAGTEMEARDYIQGKIRQAEWVCQCIGQRSQTLMRLAREILCVQETFFTGGSGKMVPWTQKMAAESLGVSESTISRTVREKYLQCRWGTFPLSYFFSRQIKEMQVPDTGKKTDAQADGISLKEALRRLIKTEDPKKPFSDRVLSEKLAEEGLTLSRRTVAKYREEMGIRDASGRKCF